MPTLTAKQRKCTHPYQHVHPTYDDRWETCDLCHIVRTRPLPAPWIVAHDEEQPAPPPPPLFSPPAGIAEQPAPAARKRRKMSSADVARRDDALLGLDEPAPAPDLTPEQQQTCPRCLGVGVVPYRDAHTLALTDELPTHPTIGSATPPETHRPCPRCQGARVIARYSAANVRPEDTAPRNASSYAVTRSASA